MGISRTRSAIYNVIVVLTALALIGVLVWSTLISGANAGTLGAYTRTIDAARGDILDRNGSVLVSSRLGNSIKFNATAFPKDQEKRNEIIRKLGERGVATNVHFKPLPMMTAYKALGWDIKDFPNAYDYYRNLISLPLHTKLSDEDAHYVCEVLKDVLKDCL